MSDDSVDTRKGQVHKKTLFRVLFVIVVLIVLWLLWGYWGAIQWDAERITQVDEVVLVPDVVGVRRAEAVERLQLLGFQVDYRPDTQAARMPGRVDSQDPPAGAHAPYGSLVRLVVSAAPDRVRSELFPEYAGDERRVPDVMGWTRATAINQLETAGFRVSISEGYSDTFPPDSVMRQRPSSGTTLTVGSTVAITMSRGTRPVGKVAVPQTLGMTEAAAIARLRAAGLVARPTYQPSDDDRVGLVNDQAPFAGDMIVEGGRVVLVIGVPR